MKKFLTTIFGILLIYFCFSRYDSPTYPETKINLVGDPKIESFFEKASAPEAWIIPKNTYPSLQESLPTLVTSFVPDLHSWSERVDGSIIYYRLTKNLKSLYSCSDWKKLYFFVENLNTLQER